MSRVFALLVLAGLLAACAATAEPTEDLPTQTPWIIVVTATPGREGGTVAQATLTPRGAATTPTRSKRPSPTATGRAAATRMTAEVEETAGTTPTAERPASTPLPATATSTPGPGQFKYPAPELLEPPAGQRVVWKGSLVLEWASVGELAADEYYALEFYRPPRTADMQPYGDYVFVKETKFLWEGDFQAPFHPPEVQGEAEVLWWVRVVRKTGEDEHGKPLGADLSLPSSRRTLILDPKPEGQ